ncbi:MAG: RNA polymerase sigma factor SigX [Thermoanaerobacterales bacterium]|nr:RNA polymerase sigma factor SigX [Thermoanaerobacterales bacterium]
MFDRYYPEIFRQLAYILGNRDTAEDLAQETFLKLYAHPPRHQDNLPAWLRKVAVNLAYKHLQKEQNRRRRELKIAAEDEHNRAGVDPVTRRQEVRDVRAVLETLSRRDRTCLLLRFSGYSYAEIAEIIGVEPSSVGTLLARARSRFRDEYNRREGGA